MLLQYFRQSTVLGLTMSDQERMAAVRFLGVSHLGLSKLSLTSRRLWRACIASSKLSRAAKLFFQTV